MKLSKEQMGYLERARVARLGTVDQKGRAHIVPIVFANTANEIFFVVDKKTKRQDLKRLKNIANNP
ncbi:MAG: TIGR03668 family PPOX class F420-dependent oxidoreductase, partial [Nitrososphaerales archaeon]